MVDGITPAVVFPLFNFILRTVQTGYDIAAVPAETGNYLQSISQVLSDIKSAKRLRRQKEDQLDHHDLERIDNAINNTEDAMAGVEVLVERARVDMSCNFGKVGAISRIMWVMRDSSKMTAAMARLGLASQSLHQEVLLLELRAVKDEMHHVFHGSNATKSFLASVEPDCQPGPPSYLEATMKSMSERRELDSKRALSLRDLQSTTSTVTLVSTNLSPYDQSGGDSHLLLRSATNMARYIKENEGVFADLAPSTEMQPPKEPMATPLIELPAGYVELESSSPSGREVVALKQALPHSHRSERRMSELTESMAAISGPVDIQYTPRRNSPAQINEPVAARQAPNMSELTKSYPTRRSSRSKSIDRFQISSTRSTSLIPGLKQPVKPRFPEDFRPHVIRERPRSAVQMNLFAHSDDTSVEGSDTYDENATESMQQKPVGRQRPLRVQRDFSLQIETRVRSPRDISSGIETPGQLVASRQASRRARTGISRAEWQLEQQKASLSSINQAADVRTVFPPDETSSLPAASRVLSQRAKSGMSRAEWQLEQLKASLSNISERY